MPCGFSLFSCHLVSHWWCGQFGLTSQPVQELDLCTWCPSSSVVINRNLYNWLQDRLSASSSRHTDNRVVTRYCPGAKWFCACPTDWSWMSESGLSTATDAMKSVRYMETASLIIREENRHETTSRGHRNGLEMGVKWEILFSGCRFYLNIIVIFIHFFLHWPAATFGLRYLSVCLRLRLFVWGFLVLRPGNDCKSWAGVNRLSYTRRMGELLENNWLKVALPEKTLMKSFNWIDGCAKRNGKPSSC